MATLADYGPEVRAEVKQVREVVAALHEQLVKWNLVVWTAGNVSQRLRTADLMVIKPSGLRYEYLTPSSMVVCDLDGNVVDGSESPRLIRRRMRTSTVICRTCTAWCTRIRRTRRRGRRRARTFRAV